MLTKTDRVVNRHKARLMCNLEDMDCPNDCLCEVANKLDWLRSDLRELDVGGVEVEVDGNK